MFYRGDVETSVGLVIHAQADVECSAKKVQRSVNSGFSTRWVNSYHTCSPNYGDQCKYNHHVRKKYQSSHDR